MLRFEKGELTKSLEVGFSHEIRVRFQDVDAAGIVFFGRFFDMVHEAYECLLQSAGEPLSDVLEARRWAAPLRHVEADYFSPARYGDRLTIGLSKCLVEQSEVYLGWCVWRGTQALAALQTVHVFVSPKDFRRIPVPMAVVDFLVSLTECVEPAEPKGPPGPPAI